MVNNYEVLFIINPTLPEDAVRAAADKFIGLIKENGEIQEVNEWGKRRLAYPINDLTEGYYVLVNFKSAPDFPLELERVFGITDGIMRSIVVKHDEKKAAAKPAEPAEAPAEAPADAE